MRDNSYLYENNSQCFKRFNAQKKFKSKYLFFNRWRCTKHKKASTTFSEFSSNGKIKIYKMELKTNFYQLNFPQLTVIQKVTKICFS